MDNLMQLVGRLHPLIVHLPIGVIMLAIVLHLLIWRGKYTAYRGILPFLWLISFITAVSASITGYMLSLDGGYSQNAISNHMWMGIGLVLLTGFIYISLIKKIIEKYQYALVAVAGVLLMATGHFGGNLTHGENFLTQPLYAMAGIENEFGKVERKPITNIQEAVVFQDLVDPILEEKCYRCHSSSKQKGDLRLDTRDHILKGGEQGEVIIAGNAEKSSLYSRLVLPLNHDEHMPPKGKPQLTDSEITLIGWWVNSGGDFNSTVAEIEKDEEIKTILADFTGGAVEDAEEGSISEIPTVNVGLPDFEIVDKLKGMGVTFTPLTTDSTFIGLNMANYKGFNDQDFDMLLKLSDHIIWLDMSGTKITDKALEEFTQFKHLTRLSLDNTAVTDKGVAHLNGLPSLQYLNLYGTSITNKALSSLQECKNLKAVYLWQTSVNQKGVEAFKASIGDQVEVNFGSNL